ncbi:UNKNOWN [Stylonychia lemnae]|uniref:3CxxC-type domain-containing protein n=1 Tax=Stylonychia lemnae TaxID=5949 RepID=A0A078B573_STYLE|nr:UNKNOWN [Stylonychia lemnae]|eukprot:CDW88402.1 UNKNOWN [Stylonychia lemnae]
MVDRSKDFATILRRDIKKYLKLYTIFDENKATDPYLIIPTKLKFKCEKCKNSWTTAHGTVQFMYHLQTRTSMIFIQVLMYPQKCRRCQLTATLSVYDDEQMRVAEEFVESLEKELYPSSQSVYKAKRKHTEKRACRARNKHIKSLCMACKNGICVYNKEKQKKYRATAKNGLRSG